MQKVSILISSLMLTFLTMAQDAIVIDNTKEHKSLFDSSDPLSFVSMLQSNVYYLGYMEIEGMTNEVYESLSKSDKEQVSQFIGQPGSTPLTDEDSKSSRFGKPLIVEDPVSGQQSFVY